MKVQVNTDHGLGKLTVGHDWVCLSVYTRVWGMLHMERIRRPWCVLLYEELKVDYQMKKRDNENNVGWG